jgi:soluble lytic murein transglycosylase-like protein
VDVKLALAVASVESNFDVSARSPKNAQGVMQLIPETAARFNVKNTYNAEQNIRGGLAYLRWLLTYFDGDMVRVVAAYNAGEKAVDKYQGIPPYHETQAYVRLVLYYAGR